MRSHAAGSAPGLEIEIQAQKHHEEKTQYVYDGPRATTEPDVIGLLIGWELALSPRGLRVEMSKEQHQARAPPKHLCADSCILTAQACGVQSCSVAKSVCAQDAQVPRHTALLTLLPHRSHPSQAANLPATSKNTRCLMNTTLPCLSTRVTVT